MPRLAETIDNLVAINTKAYEYAQRNGAFGTPSIFREGRVVISFEEQCRILNRLRTSRRQQRN